MHAAVMPEGFLDNLFSAIDAKDAERFASFIVEDGEFRFGSAPVVKGRDGIAQAVSAFFDSIDGLSHTKPDGSSGTAFSLASTSSSARPIVSKITVSNSSRSRANLNMWLMRRKMSYQAL